MTSTYGRMMGLARVALGLAGCAGKQYVPPPDGIPDVATATFLAASISQSSLEVIQFDKKGGYQGNTDVTRIGSSMLLRMIPGEQRFFTLRSDSLRDVCRAVPSFVPASDGKYRLVKVKEFPRGVLGVRTCGLRVEREWETVSRSALISSSGRCSSLE